MLKNIVIKTPLIEPRRMFCKDEYDDKEWENEKDIIYYTEETFLPQIMIDLGIVKSRSEVRRNKPELFVDLNYYDYLEIKWGKHRLYILVGE